MNILVVHNFYQQPGGEDEIFHSEIRLLRQRGHRVEPFTVHNNDVASMGQARLAIATVWNAAMAQRLESATRDVHADIVHFHNTFPLISPAAYRAAHRGGAAVVQALHNFRLLCPKATFFRDGRVCMDCHRLSLPAPALRHRCYRGSLGATAATVSMLVAHRALGTYRREVDRYIASSEFMKRLFVEAGFDAERIVAKPNFLETDPPPGQGSGGYLLFVGRLVEEKGVRVLLDAWRRQTRAGRELRIVGDGPLRDEVSENAKRDQSLRYLGRQPIDTVRELMSDAEALLFPSLWFEGMPRTIVESLAVGTPVLASDLGAMPSIIRDGENGWLVPAGEVPAWQKKLDFLLASEQPRAMRAAVRADYLARYTAASNYRQILEIYEAALRHRRRRVDR